MFALSANKNQLTLRQREPVTSGSVNVCTARFEFSPDWKGLTTKAVFRGSGTTKTVLLDGGGECVIPWEVLTSHGQQLLAGVFGSADETALPTIWANLGTILEGVPGDAEGTRPPTPEAWEQELEKNRTSSPDSRISWWVSTSRAALWPWTPARRCRGLPARRVRRVSRVPRDPRVRQARKATPGPRVRRGRQGLRVPREIPGSRGIPGPRGPQESPERPGRKGTKAIPDHRGRKATRERKAFKALRARREQTGPTVRASLPAARPARC